MERMTQHSVNARFRKPNLGHLIGTLGVVGLVVTLAAGRMASAAEASRRPNIVILLGDDMGFSDLGSYGSEIKTPNMDSLIEGMHRLQSGT
jgi:arylsulfatase